MTLSTTIAGLRWTDASGPQEHLLRFPLLGAAPTIRRPSWSLQTLSGDVHTEKFAGQAHEITGLLRFEARPVTLLVALSDRLGRPITYFEARAGQAEMAFPALLVAVDPGSADTLGLTPDPDRAGFGEYQVTIQLRRVDGGDFGPLLSPGGQ